MTPAELTARGVRVKPLVWKEYPSFWRADTALAEAAAIRAAKGEPR